MRDSHRQVLDNVLEAGSLGHREHLQLAWRYVRRYSNEDATEAMLAAIADVARRNGAEEKCHETLTRTWLHFVAVHDQRWGADSFDEFIDRNPELLDRHLAEQFYSDELVFSPDARMAWRSPDRRPLPALA